MVFKIYKAGETLLKQTLTQDVVFYDDISTAFANPSYDNALITCVFPGYFQAGADQSTWVNNTVSQYQENGLPGVVHFAPFYYMDGVGGWNQSQVDEMITIVFPGFVLSDYSVELVYAGKYIDPDNNIFAMANVTLGGDVASAKAVVPGRNAVEDGYKAIVQGLSNKVTEFEQGGEVRVQMPADVSGVYTLTVVTYDANGNPQKYEGATFNYTSSGEVTETWKEIAVGTFTYKSFFANEDGSPYDDEGLVLSQSEQNANHYKISEVFYGVDFVFTVNEDGTITFDDQYTGYTHSSYGDVMVADMHAISPEDFPTVGYFKDNVFHFNTGYYVEEGFMAYDESDDNSILETFTITGPAKAKAKAKANVEKSEKAVKKINKNAFYGKVRKYIKD